MLVTFTCKAHADLVYFGDVAVSLLKMMGHSGTVPSAILAEDIPSALGKLQAAIAKLKADAAKTAEDGDNQKEPPVPIAHRALPLLDMLEAAAKQHCDVMWR